MTGTVVDLLATQDTLICCGTGGVGKTTGAAALAMLGASQGRRAIVVTIDPARRLADAMGLAAIGNECVQVAYDGPGELWATMLDTKSTFDSLISRHAADHEQAERILTNRYYRNLSTSLSGTREYMAMEKLYELSTDDRFDLVIVDTPPTRNALDFLAAPDRMSRFVDGRLFRLAVPRGRLAKTVTTPALAVLRRIARVVSPEVVDDTLAFIEAFAGMEDGFRHRAREVEGLLGDSRTGFVVVSTATKAAVTETTYFIERLAEAQLSIDALIFNRLHPRPTGDLEWLSEDREWGSLDPAVAAARALVSISDAEGLLVEELAATAGDATIAALPLLDHDIHDLTGIAEIAELLATDPASRP